MPLATFCKLTKCKHMGTTSVHCAWTNVNMGLMTQTICKLTMKTPRQTKDSECKKEIGDCG